MISHSKQLLIKIMIGFQRLLFLTALIKNVDIRIKAGTKISERPCPCPLSSESTLYESTLYWYSCPTTFGKKKKKIILASYVNKILMDIYLIYLTLLERLPQRWHFWPNPILVCVTYMDATTSKNMFLKHISWDQLYQFWSSYLLQVQIKNIVEIVWPSVWHHYRTNFVETNSFSHYSETGCVLW